MLSVGLDCSWNHHAHSVSRSVRIGKILIQRDEETHQPKVKTLLYRDEANDSDFFI